MTSNSLMDLVRKKKSAIQEKSNRKERTIKLQNGKTRVRILPTWRSGDDVTFFHDFGQHWIKDEAGKVKAVVICQKATHGEECPFCDMIDNGIDRATDDEQIKMLSEAKAANRVLVNALIREGGGSDDPNAPVILELPVTVFESICNIIEEHGDITDTAEGLDVVIERSGKGREVKYSVTASSAAKSKTVPKAAMMALHNLDEYVKEAEEANQRALKAMQNTMGLMPSGAAAMLTGPKATAEEADYEDVPAVGTTRTAASNDEVPELEGDDIEDGAESAASSEQKASSEDTASAAMSDKELGEDLSDDDIDAMLGDLD